MPLLDIASLFLFTIFFEPNSKVTFGCSDQHMAVVLGNNEVTMLAATTRHKFAILPERPRQRV